MTIKSTCPSCATIVALDVEIVSFGDFRPWGGKDLREDGEGPKLRDEPDSFLKDKEELKSIIEERI